MNNAVFVTDHTKLAAALGTCGFRIININRLILEDGRERFSFEIEPTAHGIKADELKAAYENKLDIGKRVDAIIKERGLTEEEYCLIAFDAARAALHSRNGLLQAAKSRKGQKCKSVGDGRLLIYYEDAPKEYLKKLIRQ